MLEQFHDTSVNIRSTNIIKTVVIFKWVELQYTRICMIVNSSQNNIDRVKKIVGMLKYWYVMKKQE